MKRNYISVVSIVSTGNIFSPNVSWILSTITRMLALQLLKLEVTLFAIL
jgi:hypothetical protein